MQSRTILSLVSKRNRRRSTIFYWTSIFTTTFDFQFCHLFSILLVVFFSIWITIQYCQVDKKLSSRYYTHLFNICRLSNGQKCSRCSMVVTSPKAFLETIIHEFISSSSLVFYCSVQL